MFDSGRSGPVGDHLRDRLRRPSSLVGVGLMGGRYRPDGGFPVGPGGKARKSERWRLRQGIQSGKLSHSFCLDIAHFIRRRTRVT